MQRDICGGGCYALVNGKPALDITLAHRASLLARRFESRAVSLVNLDVARHPNQASRQLAILRDMERCGSGLAQIRDQVKSTDPKLASEIEAHPAYRQHELKRVEEWRKLAPPPEPWEGSYYGETW
jgi:hypothetical protein